MFDIGFSELLVIAVVALIVLGPERLPKAARFAGLWVRRARAQWHSVKDELERELAAEELKRNLKDAQDALRDTEQRIRESTRQVEREFEEFRQTAQANADALREDMQSALADPAAAQGEAAPSAAPASLTDGTGSNAGAPAEPATPLPPPDHGDDALATPAPADDAGTTGDLFAPREPR